MDTTVEFLLDRAGRAEGAADKYNLRALDAEDRAAELEDRLAAAETRIDDLLSRAFDAEADANQATARAEEAETRSAAWWEAAKVYCRALDFAWNDIAEYETRAEKAEAKCRALYGEFEDAARSWEVERVTLEDRAEKAEEFLREANDLICLQANRAEKAEKELSAAREQRDAWKRTYEYTMENFEDLEIRADAEMAHWEERADDAETRAASWWEAAKQLVRERDMRSNLVATYRARLERANMENRLLDRDVRHAEEDYAALDEAYDRLESDRDDTATRAAAWWEAAKAYCREVPAQAADAQETRNRLGEALRRAEQAEVRVMNLEEDLQRASATLTDETNQAARLRSTVIELRTALEEMRNRATSAETRAEQAEADRDEWQSRAVWAESLLEDRQKALGSALARAEKAHALIARIRTAGGLPQGASGDDIVNLVTRAEQAEAENARLRTAYIKADEERYELRQKLNGVETVPNLQGTINHYRARAEKAEADRGVWKERAEYAESRLKDTVCGTKPRAVRDNGGDVWVEVAPDSFTANWGYDEGITDLSEMFSGYTLDRVRFNYGPLTEITAG